MDQGARVSPRCLSTWWAGFRKCAAAAFRRVFAKRPAPRQETVSEPRAGQIAMCVRGETPLPAYVRDELLSMMTDNVAVTTRLESRIPNLSDSEVKEHLVYMRRVGA